MIKPDFYKSIAARNYKVPYEEVTEEQCETTKTRMIETAFYGPDPGDVSMLVPCVATISIGAAGKLTVSGPYQAVVFAQHVIESHGFRAESLELQQGVTLQ